LGFGIPQILPPAMPVIEIADQPNDLVYPLKEGLPRPTVIPRLVGRSPVYALILPCRTDEPCWRDRGEAWPLDLTVNQVEGRPWRPLGFHAGVCGHERHRGSGA
jgi:hypothetical protein